MGDQYPRYAAVIVATNTARLFDDVLVAGNEVAVPLLREKLPPNLASRVVDVLRLDIDTPEHEIARSTLAAMRTQDARDDRARVQRVLDAFRARPVHTLLPGARLPPEKETLGCPRASPAR